MVVRLWLALAASFVAVGEAYIADGMEIGIATVASPEDWEAAFNQPIAKGTYPTPGFNITQPWPGQSVDGWAIDIQVANVSLANAEANATQLYGPVTSFIGTSIAIAPPLDLHGLIYLNPNLDANHSTWEACVSVFIPSPSIDWTPYQNDNGSCSTVLSSQCIADLVSAGSARQDVKGSAGHCPTLSVPDSCKGTPVDGDIYSFDTIDVNIFGEETDFAYGLANTNATAARSNYLYSLAAVWPLLVSWGPSNYSAIAASGGHVDASYTSLSCVRAKNVSAGSTAPSAAPGNAAALAGAWGRVLGTVAIAAFLVL